MPAMVLKRANEADPFLDSTMDYDFRRKRRIPANTTKATIAKAIAASRYERLGLVSKCDNETMQSVTAPTNAAKDRAIPFHNS
jgi:hypothetical protein